MRLAIDKHRHEEKERRGGKKLMNKIIEGGGKQKQSEIKKTTKGFMGRESPKDAKSKQNSWTRRKTWSYRGLLSSKLRKLKVWKGNGRLWSTN